jgi:hypothetical protein
MTELTQERLKELLSYDPNTGVFTWLVSKGCVKANSVSGTKRKDGYIQIRTNKKLYLSHRLAWLYVYGELPENDLDHINEIKDDNRIVNLRLATDQENMQNVSSPRIDNTSGLRGVHWYKARQKWQSQIMVNKKRIHLGLFNTVKEAYEAYLKAKRESHLFWVENKKI